MTVAQLTQSMHVGGLETLVLHLADRLQHRGIRSPIITLTDGALLEEARRRGIETFALGKADGFSPRTLWRLAALLRRQRIDVLHTHNLAPLVYGTLAGALTRTAVINTRHGRAALSAPAPLWGLARSVVAVSEDARRELLAHNRIDAGKVSVILNGIDVDEYSAARTDAVRTATCGDRALTIGVVGRLAPEKDHQTLLRAFALLQRRGVSATLLVVGGGELAGELQRLATQLGVDSAVRFLGVRKDVAAVLGSIDLFVLPSRMEGISLTVLEAMAAGKPVVTTAVGGNPEVIVHGETGLLVEPANELALADAMATLLADPSMRARFGRAGRERAAHLFSGERMVEAYASLYQSAAAGR